MIKALIKYLLSLCILLLGGYSQLSAHANEEGDFYSPIKNLKGSEQISIGPGQDGPTFILKPASSGTEKASFTMDAAEIIEEKEEWSSFIKYLADSYYFTVIYYALTFGYLCYFIKKYLPLSKQSFDFSSYRWYLIFQVFRI